MRPMENPEVAAVFETYPPKLRCKLLALRKLIFETADSIAGVGAIDETLKWGEPAYVTAESNSGSTIRIDWKPSRPNQYGMYFHCQTDLVERFRKRFAAELTFEGNRSILFEADENLPVDPVTQCIAAALTYHVDKNSKRRH